MMTSYGGRGGGEEGRRGFVLSWIWLWHVGFDFLLSFAGCVCVCVCLGLGQCFWGSTECAADGFLGIIDLILLQTEGN